MAAKNSNDVITTYSCTVNNNSALFTMELADGNTLSFDSANYPPNVILELLAYGLKQKMADAVASRTAKDWTESDVAEKLNGLDAAMREGSFTSRAPGQSLLAQVEQAKAHLDTYLAKSDSDKALLAEVGVTEALLRRKLNGLTTKLAKASSK